METWDSLKQDQNFQGNSQQEFVILFRAGCLKVMITGEEHQLCMEFHTGYVPIAITMVESWFLSFVTLQGFPGQNVQSPWPNSRKKENLVNQCCRLKIFIYLLFNRERDSEKGNTSRGSGRGRSWLPAEQRARPGVWSQDPGIITWAEGRHLTMEPPRHPC